MEEQSKAIVEGKPLEYPEIVQDTVEVEFPEITDFVRNMKLKSGIFGFQKEDVYEKMQQLNKMYQSRAADAGPEPGTAKADAQTAAGRD